MNDQFIEKLNSKEKNRKKKKYFPDFWILRGYKENRAYELAYRFFTNTVTEEDTFLLKCETSWNKNFWISRGYTEEEAKEKVIFVQRHNSNKIREKYSSEERKKFNNACLEYYLDKGFSVEKSKELLSDRQKTFSLNKCIERHDKEKGEIIWKNRQKKWQDALNSKTIEELNEINKKKSNNLKNYIRKYGEEIGKEKYFSWIKEGI